MSAQSSAKSRSSTRNSAQAGVPSPNNSNPAAKSTPSSTPGPTTLKIVPPPIQTPSSTPPLPPPPTSPTTGTVSKLPRFLQSPAQRDRSKSLSVDRPPSAASTTSASSSGRKNTGRFLGLGKDKDKERERDRQRIREAERGQPSAAELLTLHESGAGGFDEDDLNSASSPATYGFDAGSPPSAFLGTARPRTRSERHFSASTPPSSSSSSHGHGNNGDLTLARTPSRLGVDGALGTRLSGWFAHLAGSTSDLSLTSTLSTSISHAASLAASTSRKTPASPSSKSSSSKGSGGGKPSLLDKAVRYLLDGDAAPDRNTEDIWLMGVKLPGWRREDEERVAAAAAAASSSSSKSEHAPSAHHPHITHRHKRGGSKDIAPSPLSASSSASTSTSISAHAGADDPALHVPDAGPWPAAFFAAFYAQVWCTYRAGFEPIRDLPSLSSLPPPLFFPHAVPHPSSSSSHNASNASLGNSSTGQLGSSNGTVMPVKHSHSSQQSDSSYSNSSGSAGRGASHASHAHSTASHASHASSASGSSYASSSAGSYASAQSGDPPTSTWAKKKWFSLPLPNALSGTKGWTSDTGWGCMLRTGQSLLAVALGRVGEPPLTPTPPAPFPPQTLAAHALHARLLSWFLDAPAAPFGVHRMALAGKAAGKDVGMWFGPSAAAGALRTLVDAFPICGLGVSVATDGTFYQTDVFAASHSPAFSSSSNPSSSHGHGSVSSSSSHGHGRGSTSSSAYSHGSRRKEKDGKEEMKRWGDRPVLLLLGIKLGIEGVNPVYYETIKLLYTFPQSVGIAGGRPSSSYYFVGAQGDGLFYLDPHHSRPSVPLRPFLGEPLISAHGRPSSSSSRPDDRRSLSPEAYARGGSMSPESGYARGGSMSPDFGFSRGGSMSPDFGRSQGAGAGHSPMTEDELVLRPRSAAPDDADAPVRHPAGGPLTPAEEAFYTRAYSAAELRTFHCERVRKMPMSGLDPSMLIGFVCRDEAEWVDLRRRVKELPRTIFAIVDEPPTWPGVDDDDDMGLESISDPEEVADAGFDDNDGDGEGDVSSVSHASHVAASTFSHTHAHHGSNSTTHSTSTASSGARSSEVDTEEDPVAPITPLPGSRFDLSGGPTPAASATKGKGKTAGDVYAELEGDDSFVDAGGEIEIEDDWVDPVSQGPPSPIAVAPPSPPVRTPTAAPPPLKKSASSKSKGKGKSKKAVPVPSVHYPFPVSVEDGAGAGPAMPASPPHREREQERQRNVTVSPRAGGGVTGQRMHTARARDGGRTQSGGVRGVLTED